MADLAQCKDCSVGQFISQSGANIFKEENSLCFYIQHNKDCFLYGVFDPENGRSTAHFIMQRLAADLIFHRLTPHSTHDEIINFLSECIVKSENYYMESCDAIFVERNNLHYQLQTHINNEVTRTPILTRLRAIDRELSAGCACAIVLLIGDRIFVANVGDLRVLLLRRNDDDNCLKVVQLSVDHNLENEAEVARLNGIGIKAADIKREGIIGNTSMTRCLGNFIVKNLYHAFARSRSALAPPVTASPDIAGPIQVDGNLRYMIMVSSGVYKRLQEMRGDHDTTNRHLAQIIIKNVGKSSDFYKVSQMILEEIETDFVDYCAKHNLQPKSESHMSLIIRKFHREEDSSSRTRGSDSSHAHPISASKSSSTLVHDGSNAEDEEEEGWSPSAAAQPPQTELPRIKAYVDFSEYYRLVGDAQANGTIPHRRAHLEL